MNAQKFILPAGIFLLNIIVKLIFIEGTPIGGDEPFTIFYAQADYDTLFAMFETENNPPFFTLLMKYWVQLFGTSPFSVRLLPLLFSSITAVGIFQLGNKYASKYTGIIASLIFTFASYHIYFAHECRPYALFVLLTVYSMIVFLQITIDLRKRKVFVLALLNVLLIYTHFFGFFVLFIQFLSFILIRQYRVTAWKPLFASWAITGVLYLPYTALILKRFAAASTGGTFLESPGIEALYTNLWKFSNQPVNTVLFLVILSVGVILFFVRRNSIKPQAKVIIIWFLVPYLLMFIISAKIPMFHDRYLVYISIAYYLLIAMTLDKIFVRTKLKWIVGFGLVILMAFTSNFKAGNTRGDDKLVQTTIASTNDSTAIILCPDWYFMTFAYHYDKQIFSDYTHTVSRLEKDRIFPRSYLAEENSSKILSMDRIVFVNTGAQYVDPDNKMIELILCDFILEKEITKFEPFILSFYKRKT